MKKEKNMRIKENKWLIQKTRNGEPGMKSKTSSHYLPLFFPLLLLFSLFIFSCPSPLTQNSPKKLPEGYGSFSLRIENASRTIFPAIPQVPNGFQSYTLAFTATSGGENKTEYRTNENLSASVMLKVGTYSLTVSAYKDGVLAAQGTTDENIVIGSGDSVSGTVTLETISEGGNGTFNYTVTISASGVTSATMKIGSMEPVDLLTTNSDNLTLAAGVYNIRFTLIKEGAEEAIWNEILYIRGGLTSNFNITFDENYFYRTHYNVTFVYGDGEYYEQSVMHGNTLTATTFTPPSRTDGFSFGGWLTDPDSTDLYNFNTPFYSDFTLYAKWLDAIPVANEDDLRKVGKGGGNPEGYTHWTLSANYIQTADIVLTQGNWTPIGDSLNSFIGTYNGNGHTIKGLRINNTDSFAQNQGMFGYIDTDGKVEKLGLIDVNITSRGYVSGIAGINGGTIQNCYVTGSVTSIGNTGGIGGIAGNNYGIIRNCYNTGSVTGVVTCGGIVGINSSGGTIQNCYATNSVTSSGTSVDAGGIVGSNEGGTIRNCVALNEIVTLTGTGTNIGRITGYNSATLQNNYAWSGMTLTRNNNPAAPTNIALNGKDGVSILAADAKDNSWWITATNWDTTNGSAWDFDEVWQWDNNGVHMPSLRGVGTVQPWPGHLVDPPTGGLGSGTSTDPYIVWNLETLRYVGKGGLNPAGYQDWTLDKHYKQIADITLPPVAAGSNWTRISTSTNSRFIGRYDGGGHTITGLTINASADVQGMFGYIGGNGIVENLGLINVNITNSSAIVGGIAGVNSGTIQNCYVIGSVTGTANVGGIVGGLVESAAAIIQNCYVIGSVTGTLTSGSSNDFVGGIVGTISVSGATIQNCVALNEIVTKTGSVSTSIGRIVGDASGGILQNNYAWNGMMLTANNSPVTPTAATHNGKDGESITAAKAKTDSWWTTNVAVWGFYSVWQLNGANGMPSLRDSEGNSTVLPWPGYFVDPPGTEGNPFLVNNVTDLLRVGREGANPPGYTDWTLSAHYKQTANITLPSVVAGQSNWNRIGTYNPTGQFTGTYNGDGYTITGLTIDSTSDYQGMFGYIGSGGRVENLGLIGVTITGAQNIGGIAGYNDGRANGTIGNCYVSGSVTGTSSVGGIVGDNYNGYILNCYATGDVTGTDNVGGIAGRMSNGGIYRCVALNKSVTVTGSSVGRITGPIGESFSNNYAWDGMALTANNIPVTPSPSAGNKDGADITMAAVKTQTTWVNAPLGFFSDANQTWEWDVQYSRPVLKNEVPQPWPGYLRDPPDNLGAGTQDDPFRVWNEQTLRKVGSEVYAYDAPTWDGSKHYLQIADITLTQGNWTPIGKISDTSYYSFIGTYNGGGHTITGLRINSSGNYLGMFISISQYGKVENLGLINVNITSTGTSTGGIAGVNEGTIQNCYVSGSVTGTSSVGGIVGGIVGWNAGSDAGGTIQNCYVTGSVTRTVTTTSSVGGIVGYNENGDVSGTIRNCVALNETLGGVGSNIGRITGSEDGTLQRNYAWDGMKLNGSTVNSSDHASKDGANIEAGQAKLFEGWWANGGNWSYNGISVWDFSSNGVWQWNTTHSRPVLKNEVTPQPWPGYLQ